MNTTTFAQMLEQYHLASKAADADGYNNQQDAYGCSDSYASIKADSIYSDLCRQFPQEMYKYHRSL